MKFTLEQIAQIIKEEISSVLSEDDHMDLEEEIKEALGFAALTLEELFDEMLKDEAIKMVKDDDGDDAFALN